MEPCRICHHNKNKNDLITTINDFAFKNLTFRFFYEKFTSLTFATGSEFPQKICSTCVAETNLFIIKSHEWTKNETEVLKLSAKSKSCFQEVQELYNIADKDPLEIIENYSLIQINRSNLESDGSIRQQWVHDNVVRKKVWSDIVFKCDCNIQITSLTGYLSHINSHDVIKFNCPEECNEVSNSLAAFINHISQEHFEYLSYCCFVCCKIYHNIPSLLQHYDSSHTNVKGLYICPECGLYCQTLKYLKTHKRTHDNRHADRKEFKKNEIPTIEDDPNEILVERTSTVRRRGRRNSNVIHPMSVKANEMIDPTFHPKTVCANISSDRQVFPCIYPGCSRVLMSRTGFNYHKMVHDGVKPFKCSNCTKSYRSKQLVESHERSCY